MWWNDAVSKAEVLEMYDELYDIFDDCKEIQKKLHKVYDKLNALPSVQQWIPVTERLPEDEKEVLVTRHFLSDNQLKKNAITESFYVEVASRMDDEWTSYSDEYKVRKHLHKVIAWMPLPEPYKKDEDNANKVD